MLHMINNQGEKKLGHKIMLNVRARRGGWGRENKIAEKNIAFENECNKNLHTVHRVPFSLSLRLSISCYKDSQMWFSLVGLLTDKLDVKKKKKKKAHVHLFFSI